MFNTRQFKISLFRCCPVVVSLMLSVGCASMQKVRVVSEPPGAAIKVENEDLNNTPSTIELSQKKSHTIVVQKKGYETKEVMVKKRLSPSNIVKNMGYMALVGASAFLKYSLDGKLTKGEVASVSIGLGITLPLIPLIHMGTGYLNELTPDSVFVSLPKMEETPSDYNNLDKGEGEEASGSYSNVKRNAITEIDASTENDNGSTVKTGEFTGQNETEVIIDK